MSEIGQKDQTVTRWALFGGAGFIGQHLAGAILDRFLEDEVWLLDLQKPGEINWKLPLTEHLGSGRLQLRHCDVREQASLRAYRSDFDTIVNLAAIHREPGHRPKEYFETNVSGAKNVCRFAEEVGCSEIIFTSSISVYGIHDRPVDEETPVRPRTPYGQSKYQAEKIHRNWAEEGGGRLNIIRSGVVFGKGEQGNVTRLVEEMLKRGRVLRVDPDQPKAGIYIEELLEILFWLREQPMGEQGYQLVNAVSNENLTFNSHGNVLGELRDFRHRPISVPGSLLGMTSRLMMPLAGLFPVGSKLHPQRLAKLFLANDIRPTALTAMGYPFAWPLDRAMADWLEKGL